MGQVTVKFSALILMRPGVVKKFPIDEATENRPGAFEITTAHINRGTSCKIWRFHPRFSFGTWL